MSKQIKVEEIVAIGKRFKTQFPNVTVGFLPIPDKGTVRLEVRAKSEKDLEGIKKEFEGFPVNALVVDKNKFEHFLEAEKKAGQKKQ
jgi:hypothetical protein